MDQGGGGWWYLRKTGSFVINFTQHFIRQQESFFLIATGLVAHFRCGRWDWQANVHSRRGSRACAARIDRRVTGEQQVCLRTAR